MMKILARIFQLIFVVTIIFEASSCYNRVRLLPHNICWSVGRGEYALIGIWCEDVDSSSPAWVVLALVKNDGRALSGGEPGIDAEPTACVAEAIIRGRMVLSARANENCVTMNGISILVPRLGVYAISKDSVLHDLSSVDVEKFVKWWKSFGPRNNRAYWEQDVFPNIAQYQID